MAKSPTKIYKKVPSNRPGLHRPGRFYVQLAHKAPALLYEFSLQLAGIEPKTTRVGRPRSNGFFERLRWTLLDEHFRIKGRQKGSDSVEEMQKAPDACLALCNQKCPGHEGQATLRPSATASSS